MSFLKRHPVKATTAWWVLSSARSRATVVGTTALVLGLFATSFVVWNSPANPISQAVASITGSETAADKATIDRNNLLREIVDLRALLVASQGNLSVSKAKLADIQQQLWSAKGALAAIPTAKPHVPVPASVAKATVAPKPTPTTTVAAVTAPTKAEILNPSSRYFGMFTQQAPFDFSTFDATAVKVGSTPNSVGYFGGWDQTYRGDVVTSSWKRDELPVLTWESRPINSTNGVTTQPGYTLPDIINGNFDAYLHQYAKDIVGTGLPLGIRLDHEMNGIWYPWAETDGSGNSINSNNVGDYVKMWQHVHDIFQQEGANNLVVWIWAPNIVNNLPKTHKSAEFLSALYPGDADVDMVGLSGYLRPPYIPANNFTFDYTFGSSLSQLRALTTKPIFLAEIGASEDGGHKPAWISSLFSALALPENRDIVGFSWFDLAVTTYTEGVLQTNDWRIDSRPDSLAAFVAGLALPGTNFVLKPAN